MKLSEDQAYAAMYAFLQHRYELAGSDELGALLGDMSLLPDGKTADPAIWEEWREAVAKAAIGQVDLSLELS